MRIVMLLLAFLVAGGTAQAHRPSDAYLAVTLEEGNIGGRWDIALRDLEDAIGLDGNDDGAITWGELQAKAADIAGYALARLELTGDGQACGLGAGAQLVDTHSGGAYVVLPFTADCPSAAVAFAVGYHLFADADPLHRGLVRITDGLLTHTAVLGPEGSSFSFNRGGPPSLSRQLMTYLEEGAWHIWIGFDHILFVISLLLPAVLRRTADGRWQPAPDLAAAAVEVLKIVTAFTLAHSITLTLAAAGLVSLPSRLVESVIAASIVLAALNNIHPLVTRRLWLLAFGFGLVHGLGFAGALAELGLPARAFLASTVAFNIGVELGQLAIVAAFLPAAFLVSRRSRLYRRVALQTGSLAIAVLAGAWLVERAFGIGVLG